MCTQVIDRIVISGARGFVGKNLQKFLSSNKIQSIPISRQNFKKNQFPSLKNTSHFVHLAGVGSESVDQDSFVQVNIELTKTVINLCKKNNIKNIIYFSGLGVSKNSRSSYFISKFNAEKLIKNSGLQYTIFRPSYILGDDDYLTKNISKQILKKQIVIPGSGKFLLQPISIDDVCRCINTALHSSKFSNKIIDLVGPKEITFENLLKKSISPSIKIKKITLELAYKKALTDINFEYGVEDLNILVGNYIGNHKKLQNLCDFNFKKIESLNA
ncbi:MAG: NAD-dependent epimerase/dehydratase family protein [Crenarchaeota archaeon]|nr:NAD-dependent epimerase/dehydratase family protein [Thermoproteota archaeon]MDA1124824.1 NAD-dependent epimerase/dehydratase family protein [Thermoproteota archaeon]